jgi:hypothetical protein
MTKRLLERFHDGRIAERAFPGLFSKCRLMMNILIYLMNAAFTSATFFYLSGTAENVRLMPAGRKIDIPTAITVYPDRRAPLPPRSWVERGYDVQRR